MSEIRIRRSHTLGRDRALRVACAWAERAQRKLDMVCTIVKGREFDTVHFSRGGVKGSLEVRADRLDLHARLGLLLGAFSQSISAEIEKQIDAELLKAAEGNSPDRKG